MKLFIKSILLFSVIIVSLILFAYIVIDALGWSDWAYKRFTSRGERSLILGTSRAAQGIHPDIINSELNGFGHNLPIYNYSFTMTASPYGEIYFNSIINKLSEDDYKNGLFIMSVDPWCLSFSEEDSESMLREERERLNEIHSFMKPNFYYIWKYTKPLSFDSILKLNDNGWLEVNVPMDSISLKERIDSKKKEYKNTTIKKSSYRISWLVKTIRFLKTKGDVFLVRIPASKYFLAMEKNFWPEFEMDMKAVSKKEGVPYISFEDAFGRYHTIDGQHIYKDDGVKFTKDLCDSIKLRINNQKKYD